MIVRIISRLLPLALLLAATFPAASAQTAKPATKASAAAKPAPAATSADLLDINTATPAQLKALKGIGDAYAKRIVDGRPYTAKNQLTTRGIVPQATYDGVKDQIVARAVKK